MWKSTFRSTHFQGQFEDKRYDHQGIMISSLIIWYSRQCTCVIYLEIFYNSQSAFMSPSSACRDLQMKEVIVSWGQTGIGINNHITLFWADNGTRKPAVPMTHIPQVLPPKAAGLEPNSGTLPSSWAPEVLGSCGPGVGRFMSLLGIFWNPQGWPMSVKTAPVGAQNFTSVSIFAGQKLVSNMLYFSPWMSAVFTSNGTLGSGFSLG